jgi:hypothetical protein
MKILVDKETGHEYEFHSDGHSPILGYGHLTPAKPKLWEPEGGEFAWKGECK